MTETISKILYSKTAFMCFCGIATAMIGFIVYYAITGDWFEGKGHQDLYKSVKALHPECRDQTQARLDGK